MSSQGKLAVLVGLTSSLIFHCSSGQTVTQGFSASSYSFPISSCSPGTFIGQVSAVAGGTYSTDNPNISVNPSTGQLTVLSTLTGNINFNVFSRSPFGILSSAPVTVIASCTGYAPVTYTQPVYQTPIIYQNPYYATAPVYPSSRTTTQAIVARMVFVELRTTPMGITPGTTGSGTADGAIQTETPSTLGRITVIHII